MPPLARRNLFHDKVRLTVTLTGIAFSVVLIVVELGLFLGFSTSTSSIIDHSGADIWIAAKNTPYIDQALNFNERKYYKVLATPGVLEAQKYIVRWTQWKEQNGHAESVEVIGFNPNSAMGRPWNLVAGDVEQLKQPNAVMVDEIYKKKLAVHRLGEYFEIQNYRAKVVGFTNGIRAFTTSPYVFTTFKNAQDFTRMNEDQTNFVLVKAAPGVDIKALKQELKQRLPDNDVFETTEFSRMTRNYWMFTTGAGIAVLLAALLGLVVGIVVVAQTIYATTMDHLKEYGTLKAMGAPNSYVIRVIMTQASIAALIGYGIGIVVSIFVVNGGSKGGAAIVLSWQLTILMLFVTLGMCISAAVISVNKIMKLDPAMVFKG